MKKPEKIKLLKINHLSHAAIYQSNHEIGIYNQACDDWEKWLPSEGEILKITQEKLLDALRHCGDGVHWLNESERLTICNYITKAIAKRIGTLKEKGESHASPQ